jgi:hypothetical protein
MPTQKQTVRQAKRAGHFVHPITPFVQALIDLQTFERDLREKRITALTIKGSLNKSLDFVPSKVLKLGEEYDGLKLRAFTFSGTKIRTTLALCSRVMEVMSHFNLETPQEVNAFLVPLNGTLLEIVRD